MGYILYDNIIMHALVLCRANVMWSLAYEAMPPENKG